MDKINALKAAGFELSVDDFGTGFSSLSYLKRFRLDELKIDRSFVQGIQDNRGDRAVIDAILSMAHGLDLRVVAEGVETQTQADYLTQRGCNRLQGYLYMRPGDANALESFVVAGSGRKSEAVRYLWERSDRWASASPSPVIGTRGLEGRAEV